MKKYVGKAYMLFFSENKLSDPWWSVDEIASIYMFFEKL